MPLSLASVPGGLVRNDELQKNCITQALKLSRILYMLLIYMVLFLYWLLINLASLAGIRNKCKKNAIRRGSLVYPCRVSLIQS